jgi:hypothetical protein
MVLEFLIIAKFAIFRSQFQHPNKPLSVLFHGLNPMENTNYLFVVVEVVKILSMGQTQFKQHFNYEPLEL